MTLARFTAKKLDDKTVEELVNNVLEDFSTLPALQAIVLFGSAARGEMTDASDLDVVLLFDTRENATLVRKTVHQARRKSTWPMDILCSDVPTFLRKSEIGGIYSVARSEGRAIFGVMP